MAMERKSKVTGQWVEKANILPRQKECPLFLNEVDVMLVKTEMAQTLGLP